MQHDLKRLLAFHSIENIGIILLGLGSALVLGAHGATELAALALTAALFHSVNHAVFKTLLFLGAGAVLHATGLRDLNRLGGLARAHAADGPHLRSRRRGDQRPARRSTASPASGSSFQGLLGTLGQRRDPAARSARGRARRSAPWP